MNVELGMAEDVSDSFDRVGKGSAGASCCCGSGCILPQLIGSPVEMAVYVTLNVMVSF
jgi:hypothetical protein